MICSNIWRDRFGNHLSFKENLAGCDWLALHWRGRDLFHPLLPNEVTSYTHQVENLVELVSWSLSHVESFHFAYAFRPVFYAIFLDWLTSWEKNWLVVSNIFYVHPYLGRRSNLTNIFQRGWNHQLEKRFAFSIYVYHCCCCCPKNSFK